MKVKPANIVLEKHLGELGLTFIREFAFAEDLGRKWRFDYLLTDGNFWWTGQPAIEIEGGVYSRGRHVRGTGYEKDLEKYNHATLLGFRVLRFSTGQVLSGYAKAFLASWLLN